MRGTKPAGIIGFKEEIHLFVDGAYNGTQASYGFVAKNETGIIHQERGLLDCRTSNEVEYMAAIKALSWAIGEGYYKAYINSDSRLMVNQVTGFWNVSAENLRPLFEEVRNLSRQTKATWKWIPRELNELADGLATKIEQEEGMKQLDSCMTGRN